MRRDTKAAVDRALAKRRRRNQLANFSKEELIRRIEGAGRNIDRLTETVATLRAELQIARKELRANRDRRAELLARERADYAANRAPYVYVVSDGRGRLKVGKTQNLPSRLRTLRTSAPELEVVREIEGYTGVERALHKLLAPHRIAREWFHDNIETRQLIAGWKTQ